MSSRAILHSTVALILTIWGGPISAAPVKSPGADRVNINTATAQQLSLLPGIGPTKARRIVKYRQKRPFKVPRQIVRVPGIGYKTYKKIKRYLVCQGETTMTRAPRKTPG